MSSKFNKSISNMLELNLDFKSALILDKINELQKWVSKKNIDNEDYFPLSRKDLVELIPELGSFRSVSRPLNKLKDKDLIHIIKIKTRPYCRATKKGLELLNTKPEVFKSKKETKVSDGKFTFKLGIMTEYDELNSEYIRYFKNACSVYLDENNLPRSEHEDFINYNLSIGAAYIDWGYAFKKWCSKPKTIKKNYASPVKKEGYFSKV